MSLKPKSKKKKSGKSRRREQTKKKQVSLKNRLQKALAGSGTKATVVEVGEIDKFTPGKRVHVRIRDITLDEDILFSVDPSVIVDREIIKSFGKPTFVSDPIDTELASGHMVYDFYYHYEEQTNVATKPKKKRENFTVYKRHVGSKEWFRVGSYQFPKGAIREAKSIESDNEHMRTKIVKTESVFEE